MESIKFYFIPKFFFWLLLTVAGGGSIITNIEVPLMVVIGKERSPPVLRCNYDINENHSSLVVKWYKDGQAIYQWIKGRNPTVFPDFRDKVEESEDINNDFNGIALIEPDINSTGIYKCSVQTEKQTFTKEQRMQIIDASNYTLKVDQITLYNGTHIECSVSNIYPKPLLELRTGDGNILPEVSRTEEEVNGYFKVNLIASPVEGDDLMSTDYICTLYFEEYPLRFSTNLYSSGVVLKRTSLPFILQFLFVYILNYII